MLRAGGRDLQAHGEAELALRQLALQRLAQVLDLFLVDPQVGVAGDAKLRIADDFAPGEQLVQMGVDDRGQQHEGVVGAGDVRRHGDHPRHDARRLDDGDVGFAPEGIGPGQLDDEVKALVDHLRKRVRRVEADRRQQRPDLALEILGDPGALRRVAVGVAQHANTGRGERGQDLTVERAVHLGDQRLRALADLGQVRLELLHRGAHERRLQPQLFAQAGDPDLEELVEIAADDAQETQPLEQRRGRILGQRQHAPVEVEGGQFAVNRRRAQLLDGGQQWTWVLRDRSQRRGRSGRRSRFSIGTGHDRLVTGKVHPGGGAGAGTLSSASQTQAPPASRSTSAR